MLAQRGLTHEVRDQARALLQELRTLSPNPLPLDPRADPARLAAIDAMWAWYKEWAELGRLLVTSKSLRIEMGISQPSRGRRRAAAEPAPKG